VKANRRAFLQSGAVTAAAAIAQPHFATIHAPESTGDRKYRFIQQRHFPTCTHRSTQLPATGLFNGKL
jgi:hypothetical protein